MIAELTYPQVGATQQGPLPDDYRHLRHRALLGHGREVMQAAADAVLEWRMHRATGAHVTASGPRAALGVEVTVSFGFGPLRLAAPCLVVWVEEGQRRAGFGYGTLPGHPASGEEAFVVEHHDDDSVWLTITAFSRPASWPMRLAGPVAPLLQHAYAQRCGCALRRLVS